MGTNPCMSCGRDRNGLPPERCLHKANHATGYQREIDRLRRVMAAALERTQVDDPGEATFILEREVNLDGSSARESP